MDEKNEVQVPFRFFIVFILIMLFMISLSISGWTMSLFFLTSFILFFIFFEINPSSEKYTIQNKRIVHKNQTLYNCEVHKQNAIDSINMYNDCKKRIKPSIMCPHNLQTTDDIIDESIKKKYIIPNQEYLKSKEPSNVKRVCGLIPGSKFNKKENKNNSSKLMTDKELQTLIKKHILLYNEKIILDTKLLDDPSDSALNNKLIKVQNSINVLKPIIIFNLKVKNKNSSFIEEAME